MGDSDISIALLNRSSFELADGFGTVVRFSGPGKFPQ